MNQKPTPTIVSVYLTDDEAKQLEEASRRLSRKKSALIKDAMRLMGLIEPQQDKKSARDE